MTRTNNVKISPPVGWYLNMYPPPKYRRTLQMQITSLDYSSFLGRIAVGKVAADPSRKDRP